MSVLNKPNFYKDLAFLDIKVIREGNKFITSVYRKPTFTGLYPHNDSMIPLTYKMGLIFTMLFRYYTICSNYRIFHIELEYLKGILRNKIFAHGLKF